MKKLLKSFAIFAALSIAACTDFVDPAIPYSDFDTGVYLRTLVFPASSFVFTDLETSTFSVTVEAVDIEDGGLVEEVEVFVARRRGQDVSPESRLMTVPASAFQPHSITLPNVHPASGSKYPAATIEATVPEMLQAMGMDVSDIEGGDFFEVRLSLRDRNGRVFSNNNLSPDVAGGGFFRSPFFYRVPVVCVSNLGGTYDLSTAGWCGETYTGQVRFIPDADEPTQYTIQVDLGGEFEDDFSFGAYRACYGAGTAAPGGASGLRLTDACNQIGFNSSPSSPWGDTFTLNAVTVDGPVLTLDFETSFPPEAGVATITRTDGTNWPALSAQ